MEIKATLNKPYTVKQRIDFIVEQNHQNGYEIKETGTALEAWGLTQEEHIAREKALQIAQLKNELSLIDTKSARAMRAILSGTATSEDRRFLADLETQAENLRQQIKGLEN